MLVDHRGTLAVVPHPRHQVAQPGATAEPPGGSRYAEIMKVQAASADRPDGISSGRHLVEIAAAHRPALHSREQQSARLGSDVQRPVITQGGDDRSRDARKATTRPRLRRAED
jgi:hypothetical protein